MQRNFSNYLYLVERDQLSDESVLKSAMHLSFEAGFLKYPPPLNKIIAIRKINERYCSYSLNRNIFDKYYCQYHSISNYH